MLYNLFIVQPTFDTFRVAEMMGSSTKLQYLVPYLGTSLFKYFIYCG